MYRFPISLLQDFELQLEDFGSENSGDEVLEDDETETATNFTTVTTRTSEIFRITDPSTIKHNGFINRSVEEDCLVSKQATFSGKILP